MASTPAEVQQLLRQSEVPLHHQIYLQLRAQILDGGWVGRDDFPGENELAQQFGVSVITTRKALNRLVTDGLVERGRGRRPRVLHQPAQRQEGTRPDMLQTSVGAPRPFAYKVLMQGVDIGPGEACSAFGMPPGSRLWLCSRLRSFERRPHSVTLNAQPPERGLRLPVAQLQKLPMAEILRESGVQFAKLQRRVSAALAPAQVAGHLGLTLNDPVLVYTFTQHDITGNTVQWVRIWTRPDQPAPDETFDYQTLTWSMSMRM